MTGQRWWDRDPDRLAHEFKELERAGIEYQRDEEAFAVDILRLHLQLEIDGERLPLVVTFPDLYPYFRFQVDAPTLSLDHHQNPISKNLCLIGRSTDEWHTTDTVAGLLQEQLRTVLQTGRSADREAARDLEQQQAEPYSDYYPYAASMIVMPGDGRIAPEHKMGTFVVATAGRQGPPPVRFVRGLLSEVRSQEGGFLLTADEATLRAFPGTPLKGVWVRLSTPIACGRQDLFLKELLERFPYARTAPANRIDGGWLQVWGVVFPEESGWPTGMHDGWVFVCLFDQQRSRLVGVPRQQQAMRRQKKKRNRK